jgi:hypothetical protein
MSSSTFLIPFMGETVCLLDFNSLLIGVDVDGSSTRRDFFGCSGDLLSNNLKPKFRFLRGWALGSGDSRTGANFPYMWLELGRFIALCSMFGESVVARIYRKIFNGRNLTLGILVGGPLATIDSSASISLGVELFPHCETYSFSITPQPSPRLTPGTYYSGEFVSIIFVKGIITMFGSEFSVKAFGNGLTINFHRVVVVESDRGQSKMSINALTRKVPSLTSSLGRPHSLRVSAKFDL